MRKVIFILFITGFIWYIMFPVEHDKPNVIIYTTTSKRSHGTFYLDRLIKSLKTFPRKDLIVFNTEKPGNHLALETWIVTNPDIKVILGRRKQNLRIKQNFIFDKEKVKETESDSPERVNWRTNECLDFVSASIAALKMFPFTECFLFLEDDVILEQQYNIPDKCPDDILWVGKKKEWTSKALLMKRNYLIALVEFISIYADKMPIDWLVEAFHGENNIRTHKPMFQHIGKVRSTNF